MKNLKEMIYETPEMKITCEDNMQLMARYPDNYFDLAVVDPPYGLKRLSSKTDDKNNRFSLKKADKFNNNKPTNQYWNELFRVSRNQIVWGANNFF